MRRPQRTALDRGVLELVIVVCTLCGGLAEERGYSSLVRWALRVYTALLGLPALRCAALRCAALRCAALHGRCRARY
jgi:hypothetical protein